MPGVFSVWPKSATRCLLGVVTTLAIWAANYSIEFARAARERQAISALSEHGAHVRTVQGRRLPCWLQYVIGPRLHDTQYLVQLPRQPITSEEIGLLEKVPHLFQLLPPATVSERELAVLRSRFPHCAITPR